MSAEILFFTGPSISRVPGASGTDPASSPSDRATGTIGAAAPGSKRWQADIVYRTVAGPMTLTFQVEEIEDVAKAVAEGPDWRCIDAITITLCRAKHAFAGMQLPLGHSEEDGA